MDGLYWKIPSKWMIWGYPYFRRTLYILKNNPRGLHCQVSWFWNPSILAQRRTASGNEGLLEVTTMSPWFNTTVTVTTTDEPSQETQERHMASRRAMILLCQYEIVARMRKVDLIDTSGQPWATPSDGSILQCKMLRTEAACVICEQHIQKRTNGYSWKLGNSQLLELVNTKNMMKLFIFHSQNVWSILPRSMWPFAAGQLGQRTPGPGKALSESWREKKTKLSKIV